MKKQYKTIMYVGLAVALVAVGVLKNVRLNGDTQSSHTDTASVQASEMTIPLVRSQVVTLGGAEQNYTYSGEVRGRNESELAFQVGGRIIKRNVELGSVVKPGMVLMQLDPKDVQQTALTTEAQIASAEAQLKLAQKNLKRYAQLYQQKLVSQAVYDQYKTAAETAEATVQQVKSQYADNKHKVAYCNLVANSAGVVASIVTEVGQVVSSGDTVMTLVQDNEKEVEINLPENRVEDIQRAPQLTVVFWALPEVSVTGIVREIAPMADANSRTYKVRISLKNPPEEIKLGMTAEVRITDAGNQVAAYIPISAVYQTGETPAVWVVTNDVVNRRPVKIGMFGDNQVEVLDGLKGGEVIVIAGVHKLMEGQKVRAGGDE